MLEVLEDQMLFFEAERRMKSAGSEQTISYAEVMRELGIEDVEVACIEEDSCGKR